MRVISRKRVIKDIQSIKNRETLDWIYFIIEYMERSGSITDIPGFKWLTGYPSYGRISVLEYRIIVQVFGNTVIIKRVSHRSNAYNQAY